MRLGCCVPRERIAAAREAGYDFAELTVVDNLRPVEGEEVWQALRAEIRAGGLPVEAANVFFPGDWHLTGPEADLAATHTYVETAVRRAAELGIAVMVFGSGRARSAPEGFSAARALEQLRDVLLIMGDAGARHGVAIALEPLRQAETNLVHTVVEAAELVRPLGHPWVGVLADYYHMHEAKEPLTSLLEAGRLLRHVHVSDPDRGAPTGQHNFADLIAHLRQAGYQGRISVECRWEEWERESAEAARTLRRYLAA
jgi:sugar phosphate isomerase/epimerase